MKNTLSVLFLIVSHFFSTLCGAADIKPGPFATKRRFVNQFKFTVTEVTIEPADSAGNSKGTWMEYRIFYPNPDKSDLFEIDRSEKPDVKFFTAKVKSRSAKEDKIQVKFLKDVPYSPHSSRAPLIWTLQHSGTPGETLTIPMTVTISGQDVKTSRDFEEK